MLPAKKRAGIIAAAFTDHLAVFLHIARPNQSKTRGRGYWKLNASLMKNQQTCASVQNEWDIRKKSAHHYPSNVRWWYHLVKRRIHILFHQIGAERRKDRRNIENFYYASMYDLLQDQRDYKEKAAALKHLKAKIVRLNGTYYRTMMVDNSDNYNDEDPSLFHLIKTRKLQVQRRIHTLQNTDGSILTTSHDIQRAFTEYFKTKYDTIPSQNDCLK
jgi:hypothetical protein